MALIITQAGSSLKARLQAEGKALIIDRFIFANIEGQDPTQPIAPGVTLPEDKVVYDYPIPEAYRAYVNPNQVVYSALLGSDIGDFSFNWQGLYCSEYETLVAVATFPAIEKRANNLATGQVGNNVTRNFLLQFQGAQAVTQITVEAAVWQLDFTTRLKGIDERERLSNRDLYGRASFLDSGWQLSNTNGWRFEPGRAYLEGLRLALEEPLPQNQPPYPCSVWLDACMQPEGSDVAVVVSPLFLEPEAAPADYTSNDIFKVRHYMQKVAEVDAAGNITDLRIPGVNGPAFEDVPSKDDVDQRVSQVEESLGEHIAQKDAHGATVTATAGRLVLRDANGRTHVAAGVAASDAVNLQQMQNALKNAEQNVWISGEYAPVAGAVTTATHGLALANPLKAQADVWLVCKEAEFGYAAGDVLRGFGLDVASGSGGSPVPPNIVLTPTTISITTGTHGTGLAIKKQTGTSYANPTLSKWRYMFVIHY